MPNPSKLQRIGAAALWAAQPAVWLLLALGVTAFLLLPLAAKKCYLDEKALLVGGTVPTVRQSGAVDACLAALQRLQAGGSATDFPQLVRTAAAAMASFASALEFYQHNFSASSLGDGPGGADSSSGSAPRQCRSMHAVVRTPRGDGNEGYVLMLPLDASRPAAAALAAAAGVAALGHLRSSRWLAKDAVLLFADTQACGAEESAQAWLAAYNGAHDLFGFPRAGLLQQALVLELAGPAGGSGGGGGADSGASSAELSVHGGGSLLPNLDLYYLVKRNLELHTTLPVGLRASAATPPAATWHAGAALAAAAGWLGLAPPPGTQRYASDLQTLAAFAGQLARGEPTGAHAAFLAHQVDAATLTLRFAAAAEPPAGRGGGAKAAQRAQLAAHTTLTAMEMVLRTFNNLQERLHHSTALYALVSPTRFVSIAAYLAPPACLLLAALAQVRGVWVAGVSGVYRWRAAQCRCHCGRAGPRRLPAPDTLAGLTQAVCLARLLQLIVASRAAAAAGAAAAGGGGAVRSAAWHAAWRRVAACHAVSVAVGAVGAHAAGGGLQPDGGLAWLGQQLLWAAAVGLVAAQGPRAMLAALYPNGSEGGGGDGVVAAGGQVQLCVAAVGLAAVVLRGAHLLMGQWRCTHPIGGRAWYHLPRPRARTLREAHHSVIAIPTIMRRAAGALLCACLLALAAGRCSANPRTRPASSPAAVGHGRQLTATDPYAPKTCPTNMVYENIYDAAYCMKLTTTVLAINAAGMIDLFTNAKLQVTFFAMDNEAWTTLGKTMDPPLTVQQILQNQGLTVQIMQAHMVDFPFTTSYWPATGTKTVNAVLAGRKLTLKTDEDGNFDVYGFMNVAERAQDQP
ncbi:hypothetical protein CHLNCDRAFT_49782 [Chlorella variabilis]|uniref:FAS1 domain-containing protein n=1 Tax=Chlorella variabilis TaxID=554065 RepID=E1Z412_CHLVA|nr:hypothetical protein CHLNCDRAFT_49782 [Chlorella variabilis]EFN58972.1 hypothetical protein CHLNCDRAFT_49782 [Chlorella variabilis]|eukprot:XP_005851074.1 hypothetical protein CHLNCDRAFT_49782 [Chlorella variabilis]